MAARTSSLGHVGKFLYNHNPFYIISSGCILYGLQSAFRGSRYESDAFLLASCIMAYTVVLLVTAILVVRLGKVWDDARSLFLVILLQFLALSVSFDQLCYGSSSVILALSSTGLLFAITTSKALLRFLKIKLHSCYRLPYYAALALFFLFPLAVSPSVTGASTEQLRLRVYLFPTCAALVTLMLIPAIRLGRRTANDNGTPWRWPLMPWSLFFILGLGVMLRSYAMTLSFLPLSGLRSTFAPFYLVPFLLSVIVLIFEIGRKEKNEATGWACFLSLLLIPLAGVGLGPRQMPMVSELVALGIHPIGLTAILVCLFQLYMRMRGVSEAGFGVGVCCLILLVSPLDTSVRVFRIYQAWPVAFFAFYLMIDSFQQRRLHQLAAAWTACGAYACLAPFDGWIESSIEYSAVSVHVWLVGMLVIGNVMSSKHGRQLCQAILVFWLLTSVGLVVSGRILAIDPVVILAHCFAGLLLTALHWRWMKHLGMRRLLLVNSVVFLMSLLDLGYLQATEVSGRPASPMIQIGIVCFLMGIIISARKAGAFSSFGFQFSLDPLEQSDVDRVHLSN